MTIIHCLKAPEHKSHLTVLATPRWHTPLRFKLLQALMMSGVLVFAASESLAGNGT